MPIVDQYRKAVRVEPYNLGRFAVRCAAQGYQTLGIRANPKELWDKGVLFTVVSGVPFDVAAEIATKLPSRRDESKSDKPDPNVDNEGKTPKDGGEREK